MAEPSPTPLPQPADAEAAAPVVPNGDTTGAADVEMKDDVAAIDTNMAPAASAPTPTTAAPAVSTPSRHSPHPQHAAPSMPAHPNPHGSPTRVYLNQNVTPHLLEAMKHLVTAEPDKPLKWLSEFLAQKSLEIEGP